MKKNLFLMAALLASLVSASQEDSLPKSMDEVVLTANKVEQKQSTTGKVIIVINKEQLQQYAGRTVLQVLNDQAGIVINGAFQAAGTVHSVFTRGASTGRTLILLNGVPASDPSMLYNEFDLNLLSIQEIERIEICKGAQSTLYGSDAIAGVINIITVKKDNNKKISTDITALLGNRNTTKTDLQLSGSPGKFNYQLAAGRSSTNGFSSAYDPSGTAGFDKDGFDAHHFMARVGMKASSTLGIHTSFRYSRYKADVDAGSFADEKDFTIRNQDSRAGLGFQYKKEKFSLTGNYYFEHTKRRYLNDSVDKPGFTTYEKNNYRSHSHFAELYSSYTFRQLVFISGVDFRSSGMEQDYLAISAYGPFTAEFPDTVYRQFSVYSSLLFHSDDNRFNLELGGRYNHHSKYHSNATFTLNPSWMFNKKWRVFGSIATGYKTPSLYELYDAFSGSANLKPERSTNYEAGVQESGNCFSNRLVLFHRRITNGLDFDYVNFRYFNFVKQTVTGFEWETEIRPVNGLVITANYTFIGGKEITQSRENFNDTTYHYMLRRPKHAINLNAGYQFKNGLTISLNSKYVSKRYDFGGFQAADVALKGYFLLNAYLSYKCTKQVLLFTDLQNILDNRFFETSGFSAIPFSISAGVRVNL